MIALPILLPVGFSSTLSVGDSLAAGHILAIRVRTPEEVINIAKELNLPLHKTIRTLQKNPGDTVKNGDILALNKRLFGWKKEAIVSKVDGIVERYERETGIFVIKTSAQTLTEHILSPVDGTV